MDDTNTKHESAARMQDPAPDAGSMARDARKSAGREGSAIVAPASRAADGTSAIAAIAAAMHTNNGALAGLTAALNGQSTTAAMAAALTTKTDAFANLTAALNRQSTTAAMAAALTTKTDAFAALSAVRMHAHTAGFAASFINGLMAHATDASRSQLEVAGFRQAARTMFDDLGLDAGTAEVDVPFAPTLDDRAYEVISRAAPEIAIAVNAAAAKVPTPFWSRRAVRNALAWVLVTFVTTAYVIGAVLPQPWASILTVLLGLSGASAREAYRLVNHPGDDSDSPLPPHPH